MMQHRDLIKQLGGARALTDLLTAATGTEWDYGAVRGWPYRGVAFHARPLVARLAAERGIPLPDGFLDPAPRREKGAA